MSRRWSVASDPKLLARIEEQERRRGGAAGSVPNHKLGVEIDALAVPQKKQPSAAAKRVQKVAANNQDSRRDSVHYDEDANTLAIVLAGAELLSLNTALRLHHAKQAQLKATWLKRIEALMLLNIGVYDRWKERQGMAFPLVVEEVYATSARTCLDVESVTAACKPIIDALVRTRFIPDDSPEFIAQPIAYTFRQQQASGLVLFLRPAPRPWGVISDSTMDMARRIPALPE